VMAVYRETDGVDSAHVLAQIAEELREFIRNRIPHRIRDVDRGGTGLDRGLDHLGEELELRARSILGRELHVLAESLRHSHPFDGRPQDFLLSHVELVLAVDGAGREEYVNPPPGRICERPRGKLDVVAVAACQSADDRPLNLAADRLDALPVTLGGGG